MASTVRNYSILVLGFCEMLIFCGPIYGWAALVYVLKRERFYADLCQNQSSTVTMVTDTMNTVTTNTAIVGETCTKQDAILNLVFTITSFVFQGSLVISGVLFDQLGTRFTRITLQ